MDSITRRVNRIVYRKTAGKLLRSSFRLVYIKRLLDDVLCSSPPLPQKNDNLFSTAFFLVNVFSREIETVKSLMAIISENALEKYICVKVGGASAGRMEDAFRAINGFLRAYR